MLQPGDGLFDKHHLAEKRLQRALGITEEWFNKTPAINLPQRASKFAGKDLAAVQEVFDDFGGKIVYHKGEGSVTEAITKAFQDAKVVSNYHAGSAPIDAAKKIKLLDAYAKVYKETFKDLNMWGPTKEFLMEAMTKSGCDFRVISHLAGL